MFWNVIGKFSESYFFKFTEKFRRSPIKKDLSSGDQKH